MPLNINTVKTPGVYIDEVSLLPPSVAAVETSIPAFIGHTGSPLDPNVDYEKDILMQAVKINSMPEYEQYFGKPPKENENFELQLDVVIDSDADTPEKKLKSRQLRKISVNAAEEATETEGEGIKLTTSGFVMHYALQQYFANGGGPCYIISVGNYDMPEEPEEGEEEETTASVDVSKLQAGLTVLENEDEPTLIVFPEAPQLRLTNFINLHKLALEQSEKLKDRFVIMDVPMQGAAINIGRDIDDDENGFRNLGLGDANVLRYGAAYYPYLSTLTPFYFGEETSTTKEFENIGIAGITVYDRNNSELTGDDVPAELTGITDIAGLKANLNDLYQAARQAIRAKYITLPPSAAVAGIYAKVDRQRGVWKAPANVTVGNVVGPTGKINDDTQAGMNVDPNSGKSVNAIRTLAGRGTVIWGARTLDGNDNEWRYINVRRFFNFVEESVKKATYRFVFEPNDANTWVTVRAMIENFLTIQWNLGALQGARPEDAFFVRVGLGQTMTAQDILEGRLIVEIGMAVVRPAEFIILRFMHKLPEA